MIVLKVTSHLASKPLAKPKVSVWKDIYIYFFFFLIRAAQTEMVGRINKCFEQKMTLPQNMLMLLIQLMSCAQLCCNPMDCSLCPWDFPGQNIGVGSQFLLQGMFLTQGSNPCSYISRQVLYHCAAKEAHHKIQKVINLLVKL